MKNPYKCAIFDVCGTLFDSNTTYDFCLHKFKCEKEYLKLIFFTFLKIKILSFLIFKIIRCDLRALIIKQLKGVSRDTLEIIAEDFYDNYLSRKMNVKVFKELYFLKDNGYRIFLASASIDIVISTIAKKNDIDFISSTLSYNSNFLCDGVLLEDATNRKDVLLEKKFLLTEFDYFYSDNIEDLRLTKKTNVYVYISNSLYSIVKILKYNVENRFLILINKFFL